MVLTVQHILIHNGLEVFCALLQHYNQRPVHSKLNGFRQTLLLISKPPGKYFFSNSYSASWLLWARICTPKPHFNSPLQESLQTLAKGSFSLAILLLGRDEKKKRRSRSKVSYQKKKRGQREIISCPTFSSTPIPLHCSFFSHNQLALLAHPWP